MDFAPSASWNSRSITHLANYPSRSLPMISSNESEEWMHAARNRLRNSPGIYGHLSPDWRPEPPRAFTIRRTATSAWRQSHPDLQLLHRRLRQCRQGLRCTPPEKKEGTPQPLRRSLADYRCGVAPARLADGAGWILSREVAGRGFYRRAGRWRCS